MLRRVDWSDWKIRARSMAEAWKIKIVLDQAPINLHINAPKRVSASSHQRRSSAHCCMVILSLLRGLCLNTQRTQFWASSQLEWFDTEMRASRVKFAFTTARDESALTHEWVSIQIISLSAPHTEYNLHWFFTMRAGGARWLCVYSKCAWGTFFSNQNTTIIH